MLQISFQLCCRFNDYTFVTTQPLGFFNLLFWKICKMSWIIEFAGNIEYCYESQNTVDKANIINDQEIDYNC